MKYTPCGCIPQANLCGLSPHGELALQANVALTPYLKLGGCGNDLLNDRRHNRADEGLTTNSEAMIQISMIWLLLK